MYRRLMGATLLLGLSVLPPLTYAQDKAKKAPAAIDAETLVAKDYAGVLKSTPGTDRMFTVTIEEKKLVPLPGRRTGRVPSLPGYPGLNGALNKVVQLQKQYNKAASKYASAKNRNAAGRAYQDMQKSGAQLLQAVANLQTQALAAGIRNTAILQVAAAKSVPNFRIDTQKKDVDFQAGEVVKVRTMVLPEQFDEKGNVKKPTKAELAALKGKDKTLPGYESSLDKLEAGQRVTVTLAPYKKKAAPADNAKDKDKDNDNVKDKDDKDNTDKKMQVKMIVIMEEADGPDKKGKKNN
jgi:hypothetical protein